MPIRSILRFVLIGLLAVATLLAIIGIATPSIVRVCANSILGNHVCAGIGIWDFVGGRANMWKAFSILSVLVTAAACAFAVASALVRAVSESKILQIALIVVCAIGALCLLIVFADIAARPAQPIVKTTLGYSFALLVVAFLLDAGAAVVQAILCFTGIGS